MEHNTCRICGGSLETVLDLGDLYPSNFVSDTYHGEKYPLCLCVCECGLVQLKEAVPLDMMYRQYWYKSALNKSMIEALEDVVHDVNSKVTLNKGDVVVDIGCNDGTMLSFFDEGIVKIGFDPAYNLKEEAEKLCDVFINDYFSSTYPIEKAKVVTSIAMFYDLEDPMEFIDDIKTIMADDGVWVIQFTDLVSMLKINAFDNICHEHLEYYSLSVLCGMMRQKGLQIFDVSFNEVNGGSIRAFVSYAGMYTVNDNVERALQEEVEYMALFENPFEAFANRVEIIKKKVTGFIDDKDIFVFGASTKGNTLLQYFGLDNTKIKAAAEVNEDKFGLRTVGTNIPIVSEVELLKQHPEYFLILPWHFSATIAVKHSPYLESGGSFISPMPEPCVFTKDGVYYL